MDNKNTFWVNTRAIIERTNDGNKEILIQWRNKKGQECWEFPGGCINMFESFYDALKREVKEETGLIVTTIKDEDRYLKIDGVECMKPFHIYQWLEDPGFGNPLGFHFICQAEGDLLTEGDETKNIQWVGLAELQQMLKSEKFARSDKLAAIQYLKENL
ncbi:MAG: NUDIX domain-containing protein [Defluviitaleaceae bacterium]|nr:NUDIX domain-containing protein [Defluviitaleaceae bacterium]